MLAATPEEPAPLWDVVTFNAVTFEAPPFRYLTVGVLGGFLGRFSRLDFHEKAREYEQLEDRDLWLVELRLTPAERTALDAAIAAERGRWYPYRFFQENCAHHLQRLLARATGALPEPSGLVAPTHVLERVLSTRLAGASFHRPAASLRVEALGRRVSAAFRRRLGGGDWRRLAADVPWLEALAPAERRLASAWFALRALHEAAALPPETQAGLARLRLLSLADPPGPEAAAAPPGAGAPIPAPRFPGYPRLRLSHRGDGAGGGRLALGARAALRDTLDPTFGEPSASEMELLSAEVSTPQDRLSLRLESAVLFSQRALGATSWIRPRTSWLLEVLAREGGLLGRGLHLEARAGAGRTWRLPGAHHAYGLATLAGAGVLGEGAALAPGLELGLVGLAWSGGRYGVRWTLEHDLLAWSRRHERLRAFARLDLSRRFGLTAFAEGAPGGRTFGVSLEACPGGSW